MIREETHLVAVHLHADDYDRFDRYCHLQRSSKAAVLRRVILALVKREETREELKV